MLSHAPTLAASTFATLDWIVLLAYFVLLLISGLIFSIRKQGDTSDYFLGGRSMPMWAVAFSVLATALSAATFIGGPEESYRRDLTYFATTAAGIIAAIIVAVFFIPAFYRIGATTVYELLERRFGTSSRLLAGGMFLLGRVFASGARLYMAGLAMALVLFGDIRNDQVVGGIAVLTVVGVAYTLAGGIRSVIWTDVIQTFVFVGAAGAALVLLWQRLPFSAAEAVELLRSPGDGQSSKLTVLDWSWDLSRDYSVWAILIGFTLFYTAAFGTDQDLAQRMLTCRTAKRGSWSVISALIMTAPVTLLFLLVGLLLWLYYVKMPEMSIPDVAGAPVEQPPAGREVFLTFIMREMPAGMTGLMMAGLFAAGLSTLNSGLNAMASSFVGDFYRRMKPGRDERHYLRVGRLATVGCGVVLGSFAALCVALHDAENQTLIKFALGVMVFAYAGLLAVFATALFTRRGNGASVAAALGVGFLSVLLMHGSVWPVWAEYVPVKGGTLADVTIAFPWKMLIATVAAFVVCCAGGAEQQSSKTAEQQIRAGSEGD